MDIKVVFENFAADFERTIVDDDWTRLEKYFADDATYLDVGEQKGKLKGPANIINHLKESVENTDRKFRSRTLIALTDPRVEGNRLNRKWRAIYTLTGAPDLVVEGEARYMIEDDLIKEVGQELTPESGQIYEQWMNENGNKIFA